MTVPGIRSALESVREAVEADDRVEAAMALEKVPDSYEPRRQFEYQYGILAGVIRRNAN